MRCWSWIWSTLSWLDSSVTARGTNFCQPLSAFSRNVSKGSAGARKKWFPRKGRGWGEKNAKVFLSPRVYVTVPSLLSCSPLRGFALVPVCPMNTAHLTSSEFCPLRFLSSIGASELYAE